MESKVAEAILQEPVRFSINTYGLLKLVGIKKIKLSIRPLYMGTIVILSKYLSQIKLDIDKVKENPLANAFENIDVNGRLLSRFIAVAVLNSRLKIKLFTKPLSNFIYWHLTTAELNALSTVVLQQSGITDFILSIVSLKGLNMLSPKQRETSPTGTGETIAPGASSEASSNTTDLHTTISYGE